MPYIDKKSKEKYEPLFEVLREILESSDNPIPKGELTYLVYALALSFFKGRESYTNISTAISSLQDAAEELRRRHLNPYEDKKIIENGDVE